MAGTMTLKMLETVQKDRPFQASVTVTGAQPGSDVTVTLEQKRGVDPFSPTQCKVAPADPSGQASAVFEVKLAGPATVVLLASACDPSGTYFRPDAESVEVE
jgi:hypothetical protein